MSYVSTNTTTHDDYNNDIKPDQNCQPLPESISCIDWASSNLGSVFACSFWDGSLRIYEVVNNGYSPSIAQKISTKAKSPLTKCSWSADGQFIYVGDITGAVQAFNVQSQTFVDIGKHNAAISAIHCIPNQNIIISAAYENNIHFWQPGNQQPVFSVDMGNKIFCSDFVYPMLIVGLANEKIGIIDINNPANKTILESSDLGKHSQIQSISINKNVDTIGLSTIDGRSNIANIIKSPSGQYTQVFFSHNNFKKSIITFKSHKLQQSSSNVILFPVNSVSFSPVSTIWFMTCGSDGALNFWDFNVRNKIKSLNFSSTPVCCAKVSPLGDFIAYGLGNDWHLGVEGNKWAPRMAVHRLTQQEMKFPK